MIDELTSAARSPSRSTSQPTASLARDRGADETLIIQHRAGGDLVRALQDLSSTLDTRRETLREVRTLMAGAVFTSYVVPLLGVGALLCSTRSTPDAPPDDQQPARDRGPDRRRALYALGSLAIRRITRVEV